MENGHSRVPVYEGERNSMPFSILLSSSFLSLCAVYNTSRIDIVNCLHMKDLALVNPEEGVTLRSFLSFYGRQIPKIRGGINTKNRRGE
jgi:hypothetical protein